MKHIPKHASDEYVPNRLEQFVDWLVWDHISIWLSILAVLGGLALGMFLIQCISGNQDKAEETQMPIEMTLGIETVPVYTYQDYLDGKPFGYYD